MSRSVCERRLQECHTHQYPSDTSRISRVFSASNTRGVPHGWGSPRVLLTVDTREALQLPHGYCLQKMPAGVDSGMRVCTRGPLLALHGYCILPVPKCQSTYHTHNDTRVVAPDCTDARNHGNAFINTRPTQYKQIACLSVKAIISYGQTGRFCCGIDRAPSQNVEDALLWSE